MSGLLARFLDKVQITEDCWIWTASIRPQGYGQFRLDGRTVYAHRLSYELFVGPIPAGLQLDHLCHNRRCVNPAHLEPVTNRENGRRGAALITHCPKGHPYSGDNVSWTNRGWRACRACNRLNVARHKATQRRLP